MEPAFRVLLSHRAVAPPQGGPSHNAIGVCAFWPLLYLALVASSVAYAQSEPSVAPSKALDIEVDTGYTYDNNVTRAPDGPDKLSDQFYNLNVSTNLIIPVTSASRVSLNGIVGGELTRNYSGLGNIFAGLQAEFQYRSSAAFYAPTLALFGRAFAEHFGSTLRSGYHYSVGLSGSQAVTDRITLSGALAHNWRAAKSSVFSTRDNSALLNADYATGSRGTLYLTGEYRFGNVVSTGTPTLQIIDIAQVFVFDDVFTSPQMIDYRFEAKTVLTTLGYNLVLAPTTSLDFSWKRVQSKSTQQANFQDGGNLRYVDDQFTVVFLKRF